MRWILLFLLPTIAFGGEHRSLIATELALATMNDAKIEKVARADCKECNGTGKIAAGDGVVKVYRDCDNCVAPPGDNLPTLIVVTTADCIPCAQWKAKEQANVKAIVVFKTPEEVPVRAVPTYILPNGERWQGYATAEFLNDKLRQR